MIIKKFALIIATTVALGSFLGGCSGPSGGASETDQRVINGKPASDGNNPGATGDVAPGQARRSAAQKGQ